MTMPNPAYRTTPQGELGRGTNQVAVRAYNERLVLSLIREHQRLPKAEIARATGLSAQTISVIVKQLEADGLLRKEAPQRGKVGQPSVPFSLDPEGALSFGLKIGRRSSELILMDFLGRVRRSATQTYPFPRRDAVLNLAQAGVRGLLAEIGPVQAARVCGLGIAVPSEFWQWESDVEAPAGALDEWRNIDLRETVKTACGLPTHVCNDATAACAAELTFGNPTHSLDYLYIFIGYFVGGGIVLDRALFPGRTGNAGALGSMPVAPVAGQPGQLHQLIHEASLIGLEKRLTASGRDPQAIWDAGLDWSAFDELVDDWIEQAAPALAESVVAACAVIDFQAAVIDGAMPAAVRSRLVERVRQEVHRFDRRGLSPVDFREGTIGAGARAIGGATLPILASFARDRDVLFRNAAA